MWMSLVDTDLDPERDLMYRSKDLKGDDTVKSAF